MTNKEIEITNQKIFELSEKILRFYLHIDHVKSEFYSQTENNIVHDKDYFLSSFHSCLTKIFQDLFTLKKEISETKELNDAQTELLQLFKWVEELHVEYLNYLPRPKEPIELRRFCRVLNKQVFNISDKSISVFVTEKLFEETFAYDPLSKFKAKLGIPESQLSGQDDNNIHITIPRIETGNPCHWPILLHEVGHHVMKLIYTTNDVYDEFVKHVNHNFNNPEVEKVFNFFDKEKLKSWLTECWCDVYGCLAMGHSFLYAQTSVFISQTKPYDNGTLSYPPNSFRQLLINKLISHRFSQEILDSCPVVWYDPLTDQIWENKETRNLLEFFESYF